MPRKFKEKTHNASKRDLLKRCICVVVILLLAFIASMQALNNPFRSNGMSIDASVFKYIGWRVTEGQIPYRDTFDHKGPLLYVINALGVMISYQHGVWVFEFIAIAVAFMYMFKMARLYCGRAASLVALVVCTVPLFKYFEGGNLTEEYALPFIAMSIYYFAYYFKTGKIGKLGLTLCGLSFGAVCMLRPNMTAIWIVMCLAVLIRVIRNNEWSELSRFIGWFVLGFAMVVVPLLAWLGANGALNDFVRDYITFNTSYVSVRERASTGAKISSLLYFMNEPILMIACGAMFYLCWVKKGYFNVAYLVYIVLSLILISISGQTYGHYGMVLVPMMMYPTALLLNRVIIESGKNAVGWFVVMLFAAQLVVPQWLNAMSDVVQQHRNLGKDYTSPEVIVISDYIRNTTKKSDKILAVGNMDVFYNYSRRQAATKYSYQMPVAGIDPAIEKDFRSEIVRAKPVVVILGKEDKSLDLSDFLAKYSYKEISPSGVSAYKVYRRAE